MADDLSLAVNPVSLNRNHFSWKGKIGIGQADAVKRQLQIAFSPKMPRVFVGLKMAYQIRAPGKDRLSEHLHSARMAEKRVAHTGGCRREVRLVHHAGHQRPRGQDNFLGNRASRETQRKRQTQKQNSGFHLLVSLMVWESKLALPW